MSLMIVIIIITDTGTFTHRVMRNIYRDTFLKETGRNKQEQQVLIAVWHQPEVSTLWIIATIISG